MLKEPILKSDKFREFSKEFDSIDAIRVLHCCLVDTYQRVQLSPEGFYPVNLARYAESGGISLGKAFSEVLDIVYLLKTTVKEIELSTGEIWVTSFVYDFKYSVENKTIDVQFNKAMIPAISGDMPPGQYAIFDGRFDRVPSNRRFLMSEILQRNLYKLKDSPRFILPLSDIRHGLNLKPEEYKDFSKLALRVITPSLGDIADLCKVYLIVQKRSLGIVFTKVNKEDFDARNKRK